MRVLASLVLSVVAVQPPSLLRDEHTALQVGPAGDFALLERTAEVDKKRKKEEPAEGESETEAQAEQDAKDEKKEEEKGAAAEEMRAIVTPNYGPRDLGCPKDALRYMKKDPLDETPAKCANECNRQPGCVGFEYECQHKKVDKQARRTGFGSCKLLEEVLNTTNCQQPEDNDEISGFPIKSLYTKVDAKPPAGFLYYPRLTCFPTTEDKTKQEAKMTVHKDANSTAAECADKCQAAGCSLMIHGSPDPEEPAACALVDHGAVSCKYFRLEEISLAEKDDPEKAADVKALSYGVYTNVEKVPGGIATHASGNFAEIHADDNEPATPEGVGSTALLIALVSVSTVALALGGILAWQKFGPQPKAADVPLAEEGEGAAEGEGAEDVKPEVGTVDE